MKEPEIKETNNLQQLREELMLSKAELARRAGISVLTVTRVELGHFSHPKTKRKLLFALGLDIVDKEKLFPSNEEME